MIPLRDNIPPSRLPIVNYVMIGLCTVVWLLQLANAEQGSLVQQFGMVPARVLGEAEDLVIRVPDGYGGVQARQVPPAAVPDWLTLLTCVFLHGGWMHFIGNMWFLFIFGDNVEDRLGRIGYLAFYLGAGVVASLTHLLTNTGSPVPTIGASGAIAGVMGAYMLLYPKAKVQALIPLGVIMQMLSLPAVAFLGIWFGLQLFQGVMAMGATAATGVAWWAHIGGFAVGAIVVLALRAAGRLRPPVQTRRPHSDELLHRLRRS